MLSQLAEKRQVLTSLFEARHRQQILSTETKEQDRVQATRKALGLAPETTPEVSASPSYELEIDKLAISAAIHNDIDVNDFQASVDLSKSPDEIIKDLSAQRAALQQQSVSVWGIEIPRTLSVEYFGSSYHVSSRFGAFALLSALTLFIVAWMGSLYMTRQRELIVISRLEDYKEAFPHIINILPVNLAEAWTRASRTQTRKQIRFAKAANRIILSVFRTLVVLMISVPMIAINVYCGFRLLFSWDNTSTVGFIPFMGGIIISVILIVQTALLVAQEWMLLWGKQFNE